MSGNLETNKPNGHKQFENNGSREKRERSFGGIKFFKGYPLPQLEERKARYRTLSLEHLRETHKVWRPEETLEAAQPFFDHNRVNIVGSPQSGKGTILFGLSEICDAFDWGYLFIDGHHQETPAADVASAILEAQAKNIPIFFDSFDYLFVKSRKVRTIPLVQQEKRTPKIVEAVVNSTVPIAITHHDEKWANLFLNQEFRDRFRTQVDTFPVYQIPDSFRSPRSIRRFLIDQNLPPQEAEFLANFAWNILMRDRLHTLLSNLGKEQSTEVLFRAAASFPVLKELARDNQEEFLPLLAKVSQQQDSIEDSDLLKFAAMILEAEEKRINLAAIRWNHGKR